MSGAAPQRVARRREALRDVEAELEPGDGSERVRLRFLPDGAEVRVPSGTPVFDAASWNGIAIDSTCGGYGTCKKCKVRVVSGELPVGPIDPRAFTQRRARRWLAACVPGGGACGSGRRGAAAADPAEGALWPASAGT